MYGYQNNRPYPFIKVKVLLDVDRLVSESFIHHYRREWPVWTGITENGTRQRPPEGNSLLFSAQHSETET